MRKYFLATGLMLGRLELLGLTRSTWTWISMHGGHFRESQTALLLTCLEFGKQQRQFFKCCAFTEVDMIMFSKHQSLTITNLGNQCYHEAAARALFLNSPIIPVTCQATDLLQDLATGRSSTYAVHRQQPGMVS